MFVSTGFGYASKMKSGLRASQGCNTYHTQKVMPQALVSNVYGHENSVAKYFCPLGSQILCMKTRKSVKIIFFPLRVCSTINLYMLLGN